MHGLKYSKKDVQTPNICLLTGTSTKRRGRVKQFLKNGSLIWNISREKKIWNILLLVDIATSIHEVMNNVMVKFLPSNLNLQAAEVLYHKMLQYTETVVETSNIFWFQEINISATCSLMAKQCLGANYQRNHCEVLLTSRKKMKNVKKIRD
jgi:hypothetical protein